MKTDVIMNVNEQNPNSIFPGIPTTTPITGVETTAPETPVKVDKTTISTLGKSEAEAALLSLSSSNPLLVPPSSNIADFNDFFSSDGAKLTISGDAATKVAMLAEQKNHEIISAILDGWLENIRKLAKEYEDKINSPQYQDWIKTQSPDYHAAIQRATAEETKVAVMSTPEYQSWVLSQINPAQIQVPQTALTRNETLSVGVVNGLDNYVKNTSPIDATTALTAGFVVASTIIGVGALAAPVTDTINQNIPMINPMHDQWAYISPLVPSNMAAELGLIGALFATGALYRAKLDNLAEAAGTGTKPMKLDDAKQYAEKIIATINSPGFKYFADGALINKMSGSEALTEARKAELLAIVKLVMLSSALALIYKVEAQKNSSQEFLSMIRGDPSLGDVIFKAGDIRAKLVNEMRKNLASLQDPAERTRILEALGEYMGTDPSEEALSSLHSVFEGLLSTTPYGERVTKEHV